MNQVAEISTTITTTITMIIVALLFFGVACVSNMITSTFRGLPVLYSSRSFGASQNGVHARSVIVTLGRS